jgi:tRNA A37 threonylcarbamoyladenosine biosynthesis protein TsaE
MELLWSAIVHSKTETRDLIASRITNISPPYILNLNGDLGAGKTFVSRCIARKYGFDDLVSSSFSKMSVLEDSKNKIIHVDYFNIQEDGSFFFENIYENIDNNTILLQEWNNTFIDIDIIQLNLDIFNLTFEKRKINFYLAS